jgi:hypothetical protein
VLAKEMSANVVTTAGPSLQNGVDLMGILTNLAERDVLYIDEIHRLSRAVEELLYPTMEDFSVNFVMDKGLNARTINIPLRPFTLVGTAEKVAEVMPRLRSLFPVAVVLQPYSESELSAIAHTFARARGLSLTPGAAALIGRFSGGSLRKVRSALQLAVRPGAVEVTEPDASAALAILGHQVMDGASSIPADLMQLSGTEFEVCVTGLLQRIGFRTELTRATGDGGIDIVAYLDRPIVGGRYLVQCKRFTDATPVGAPMVREFYGAFVADRSAVKGLFITTSSFSAQAREFVQNLPIELVDDLHVRLASSLQNYGWEHERLSAKGSGDRGFLEDDRAELQHHSGQAERWGDRRQVHLYDRRLRRVHHCLLAGGHAHSLWTTKEHRRDHSCHS